MGVTGGVAARYNAWWVIVKNGYPSHIGARANRIDTTLPSAA